MEKPLPRFEVHVFAGQPAQVIIREKDVEPAEVTHFLLLLAAEFLKQKGPLPTSADIEERARIEKVRREHPVSCMLIKDETALFVSETCMAIVGNAMLGWGWKYAPLPAAGISATCAYMLDPEAFKARYIEYQREA